MAKGDPPDGAWQAAFAEFEVEKPGAMAKLDEALDRYRSSRRYSFYRVDAVADTALSEAPFSSADAHLMVWAAKRRSAAMDRAEIDEVLREDPAHPLAIEMKARLDRSSPLDALRKSAAARPADFLGWLLLGDALSAAEAAAKEAAYRKAAALNPDSARANNALAWALQSRGAAREALPFANRAVDLAPWGPAGIDTLAHVAAQLGKCREALMLQRRAIDIAPDEQREAYGKALVEIETRCRALPAKP